jgi:hypothetical protein
MNDSQALATNGRAVVLASGDARRRSPHERLRERELALGTGKFPRILGLGFAVVLLLSGCSQSGGEAAGGQGIEGSPSEIGAQEETQIELRNKLDALLEAQSENGESLAELGAFLDELSPQEQIVLAEYAADRELAFRQVAVDLFLRNDREDQAVGLIVDGLKRSEDLLSVTVFSLLHSDPEEADALLAAVKEEVERQRPAMTLEERAAVDQVLDR